MQIKLTSRVFIISRGDYHHRQAFSISLQANVRGVWVQVVNCQVCVDGYVYYLCVEHCKCILCKGKG